MKSLYDEVYEERLAICLAEDVEKDEAKRIAHECARRAVGKEEQ